MSPDAIDYILLDVQHLLRGSPFPPPTGTPDPCPLDDHTYDQLLYVHPDRRHPDHAVPLFAWCDDNGRPYWWQY